MLFLLAQKTFTHAYDNSTTITPVGVVVLVLLVVAIIALPRRLTVLPLVLVACFIPVAQRIAILSLDFTMLRIVIIAGWLRLCIRGEFGQMEWKSIDTYMSLWGFCGTLIYVIQQATIEALVYKCGVLLDTLAMYFLIRILFRDWKDLTRLTQTLAIVTVPVCFTFFLEFKTGHNLFSIFGGVPAKTLVREGRLRCQGAFSHSILAGCFFGSLIPIFFAYLQQRTKGGKYLAAFCLFACFAIVAMCGSATPLMGVSAACVGVALFWVRSRMRLIRWAVLCTLITLHLSMKSPVWSLIERVDVIGGSTGWHRYHLINAAIKYFGEWWLIGTRSTAHWGYFLFDVANQYILEGVRGGLITLICFIAILVVAFRGVGKMCRTYADDRGKVWMAWGLGASLFAHCTAFIGVSYFGQMIVIWYLLLAVIGSLTPTAQMEARLCQSREHSRFRSKPVGCNAQIHLPTVHSPQPQPSSI